jgi:hypothetical protein
VHHTPPTTRCAAPVTAGVATPSWSAAPAYAASTCAA